MRKIVVVVAVCVLIAVACGDDGGGQAEESSDGTDAAADEITPSGDLRPRDCPYPASLRAECFTLDVPADHVDDDRERLALPVVVVRAGGDAPEDPVAFPDGGPGYSDLSTAAIESTVELTETLGRDVVLWAQRGTPEADPTLDCPEKEDAVVANFERAAGYEEEFAALRDATLECRDRLVEDGVDLDDYDTVQNAYDAIALRRALDLDQWNVIGISYGSRLGLELLRLDPEGTRAAVLDSVYPPGVGGVRHWLDKTERAFDALFDGCAAIPECDEAHPDLAATFEQVVADFDADPVEMPVTLDDGTELDLVLDGSDLYAGLFSALYDTSLIPALPGVIDGFAAGDTSIVPVLAQRGIPFINTISEGMNQSVDCADNASIDDPDRDEILADPGPFGGLLGYASDAFCADWDVEGADESYTQPVESDLPVLVLAGTYDPATPPEDSQAAADALGNATFVSFDGVGHGVLGTSDCANEIVRSYLDDPDAPVDSSCAADVAPEFT